MASQDAVVVQHLFNVELVESLHVGREILDLFVGGNSGGSGCTGRTSLHGVHGHAAKSNQDLAVHCYGCCRERWPVSEIRREAYCVLILCTRLSVANKCWWPRWTGRLYIAALGTCHGPTASAVAVYTAVTESGRRTDESGVCFLPSTGPPVLVGR